MAPAGAGAVADRSPAGADVDVLLVQPPIRDFYLTQKRTVPYGLASIAGSLQRHGFKVALLDALATRRRKPRVLPEELRDLELHYGRADRSPFCLFHRYQHFGLGFERVGELARASGAWLVGVSALFTPYAEEALNTARAIKLALPNCLLVMGGHHPTAMPEQVLRCEAVDFVIRGDGEQALTGLALALRHGEDPTQVPGVLQRRGPSGQAAASSDLAQLPSPAFELIDSSYYQQAGKQRAVLVGSRGCPLRCHYCCVGRGSAELAPYRRRPVERVLADLSLQSPGKIALLDLEDENVSLHRGWFQQLMAGMRRLLPTDCEVRAMNGLLPHTLDAERIELMARGGFRVLNLSLGTSADDLSRAMGRPPQRGSLLRALDAAESARLQAVTYIIVAMPGQDPQQSVRDLLFLAGLRTLAGVSVFYPAPGSVMWQQCVDRDLLPAHLGRMRSSALPVEDRTSRLDAATLLRLGRVLGFIKAGLDRGERVPPARALRQQWLAPTLSREEVGRTLLSALLWDGELRGVTPDGEVYTHAVSAPLVDSFLQGITTLPLRGTL